MQRTQVNADNYYCSKSFKNILSDKTVGCKYCDVGGNLYQECSPTKIITCAVIDQYFSLTFLIISPVSYPCNSPFLNLDLNVL